MPLSELDPALTAVSHKVIGAARDVHMTMGQGFDKQVYLDALKHELTSQGVAFEQNATFKPSFKGQAVGSVTTDLFVDRKFLVEVMATPEEVASWDRLRLRAKLKAA
ncbi:MAG: GxxExxY protein, partial [Phycisphaerales bacterium]|nr:GxxExxY protein [Phycisphaerales bacterium]